MDLVPVSYNDPHSDILSLEKIADASDLMSRMWRILRGVNQLIPSHPRLGISPFLRGGSEDTNWGEKYGEKAN
jgi:hypothetical protein